jgi:Tfp pilus assembly protein FimT
MSRGVSKQRAASATAGGFSIIEIVIALVVGAIAIAVVTPRVSDAYRRYTTRTTADDFVSTHGFARSMATKYGRLSELHIDPSTGRFWVQVDTAGTGVADTIGSPRYPAKKRVRVTSSRPMICFDASGAASSRGACGSGLAVIVFTSGHHADTIRITAAGNVLR